ncbi:MAG: helix-turn-helix domain-containing protein, partial [Rhizobiales bacterium]|nr:helix-turn-helix domain-containing protein [Hyphomicrobiales bacterium]
TQQVIPHPSCHLTFLKNNSTFNGIQQNIYQHKLSGRGNIVGTKFTPAGFQPFAKQAIMRMPEITNQTINIKNIFKIDVKPFEKTILDLKNHQDKIQKIEQEIFDNIPSIDDHIIRLNHLVKQIETNKNIRKVKDISNLFDLDERQIQRLFSKYIGINAKWIINRYRIHDALDALAPAQEFNWSELALELGYFDQAHFIKDFKQLVGNSPAKYSKLLHNQ